MRILTGTSGFSYKEWKGPFYPEKLPAKEMLGFYARELATVEINNTFYRMPKPEMLTGWVEQVPEEFVFVVKASQRITHRSRLQDTDDSVAYLWKCVAALGAHLGPILFQLPPYFQKDAPRLRDFIAALPDGCRAVFEFRHATWCDDEVHGVLRDGGCALCVADQEGEADPEIIATADWGYLRLRRPAYTATELDGWAERIRAQGWREAFVFFKHEEDGAAPLLAQKFARLF